MRWQTELMLKRGDSAAHRQVHGSKMGGMLCTVEGLTRSCKRSGKFSKTVAFKPACFGVCFVRFACKMECTIALSGMCIYMMGLQTEGKRAERRGRVSRGENLIPRE